MCFAGVSDTLKESPALAEESIAQIISVVIPAYNESRNIKAVLDVLVSYDKHGLEIIVVDDGSTDDTQAVVSAYPRVRLVAHARNQGKGGALATGVAAASHGVVMFLDADLVSFTHSHISDLIMPVLSGEHDMSVGVFEKGRFLTDLAQWVAPYISGQRVVRKADLFFLGKARRCGFGVEILVTKWYIRHHKQVVRVPLVGATHVMKEEKYGWLIGILRRIRMYADIVATIWFSDEDFGEVNH